jgi:hypothetical protein
MLRAPLKLLLQSHLSAQYLLDRSVEDTIGISEDVQRLATDDVNCIIITSSFAAIRFHPNEALGKVYTEDDWNPVTLSDVEIA